MTWLKLVVRYLQYHKLKTSILIASIFMTAFLPITILILAARQTRRSNRSGGRDGAGHSACASRPRRAWRTREACTPRSRRSSFPRFAN